MVPEETQRNLKEPNGTQRNPKNLGNPKGPEENCQKNLIELEGTKNNTRNLKAPEGTQT